MITVVSTSPSFRSILMRLLAWPLVYLSLHFIEPWFDSSVGYSLAFMGTSLAIVGTATASLPSRNGQAVGSWSILFIVILCVLGLQSESSLTAYALIMGLGIINAGTFFGALLGKRVRHPHHVWPLVIVLVGATVVTVLEGPSAQQGLVPERLPKSLRSPFWINVPIPGMGIDGIMNILEPVVVGFCVGLCHGRSLWGRPCLLGLFFGFVLCLGARLLSSYPISAFIFFVPAMAIALGSQVKPRHRELGLSIFVVILIWGANNILR